MPNECIEKRNEIVSLYRFQRKYLFQLLANLDDSQAYEQHASGMNSPGWIMGHLCAEGLDVLDKLSAPRPVSL